MTVRFTKMPALALALVLATPALAQTEERKLVIAGVHVVDVNAGTVTPAMDVELQGARIAAIREAARRERLDEHTLDARGAYLVPGFWDMHVHVNQPRYAQRWMLPLLLAAGVTGVRDMSGDCWGVQCRDSIDFMRALQKNVEKGATVGPRILAISSGLVHGPREIPEDAQAPWQAPADAAQARRLVQELKRRGVDFIKPYDTLPPDAYFELVREARKVGLSVSGHVPMSISSLEALGAGQISIEHAKHPLLDCSGYSSTFRRIFAQWATGRSNHIYKNWWNAARGDTDAGGYYGLILESYDAAVCSRVIREIARSDAYYVPTLITRRFEARADEESFIQDRRLPLVPPRLLADWRRDAAAYRKRFAASPAEKRAYVRFYELAVQLVGQAHAAGVAVLVGTDAPDSYCFPGSALHEEMLELQAAGLSNAAILRAATLSAAEFLGRSADFGTVEAGKVADLVVLSGNPLEDIRHASRVAAVVRNGRLLDAAALRDLKDRAAAFAAAEVHE